MVCIIFHLYNMNELFYPLVFFIYLKVECMISGLYDFQDCIFANMLIFVPLTGHLGLVGCW